jgi:hypothetical protein
LHVIRDGILDPVEFNACSNFDGSGGPDANDAVADDEAEVWVVFRTNAVAGATETGSPPGPRPHTVIFSRERWKSDG